MKTSTTTRSRTEEDMIYPGISSEEIRAAIREGERLRSEAMFKAFAAAFRFIKQVPSRLLPSGTHRHA